MERVFSVVEAFVGAASGALIAALIFAGIDAEFGEQPFHNHGDAAISGMIYLGAVFFFICLLALFIQEHIIRGSWAHGEGFIKRRVVCAGLVAAFTLVLAIGQSSHHEPNFSEMLTHGGAFVAMGAIVGFIAHWVYEMGHD